MSSDQKSEVEKLEEARDKWLEALKKMEDPTIAKITATISGSQAMAIFEIAIQLAKLNENLLLISGAVAGGGKINIRFDCEVIREGTFPSTGRFKVKPL